MVALFQSDCLLALVAESLLRVFCILSSFWAILGDSIQVSSILSVIGPNKINDDVSLTDFICTSSSL